MMWRSVSYQNQVTVALISNCHGQIKVITSGTMPSYFAHIYIRTFRSVRIKMRSLWPLP